MLHNALLTARPGLAESKEATEPSLIRAAATTYSSPLSSTGSYKTELKLGSNGVIYHGLWHGIQPVALKRPGTEGPLAPRM